MFMRLSSVSLSWVVSLNLKGVIRSSKSNRMFVTCLQTCSSKLDFLFGNKIYAWNDLRSYMPPTWRFTNVYERTKRTRRKYNCRNQADEEAHYQYIKEDLLDDSNTYISSLDKTRNNKLQSHIFSVCKQTIFLKDLQILFFNWKRTQSYLWKKYAAMAK